MVEILNINTTEKRFQLSKLHQNLLLSENFEYRTILETQNQNCSSVDFFDFHFLAPLDIDLEKFLKISVFVLRLKFRYPEN